MLTCRRKPGNGGQFHMTDTKKKHTLPVFSIANGILYFIGKGGGYKFKVPPREEWKNER